MEKEKIILGRYYWVKVFPWDKFEPAQAIDYYQNGELWFIFLNGRVAGATDYKELKYPDTIKKSELIPTYEEESCGNFEDKTDVYIIEEENECSVCGNPLTQTELSIGNTCDRCFDD